MLYPLSYCRKNTPGGVRTRDYAMKGRGANLYTTGAKYQNTLRILLETHEQSIFIGGIHGPVGGYGVIGDSGKTGYGGMGLTGTGDCGHFLYGSFSLIGLSFLMVSFACSTI